MSDEFDEVEDVVDVVDTGEVETPVEVEPTLVDLAKNKLAADFKDCIESKLKSLSMDAIDQKKQDMAKTMFNKTVEEPAPIETEDA